MLIMLIILWNIDLIDDHNILDNVLKLDIFKE
jgi:hypothetical protein